MLTVSTVTVSTVSVGFNYHRITCPKHEEFYSKNKFEKLVHLVGFIIRKYLLIFKNIYIDQIPFTTMKGTICIQQHFKH